MSDAAAAAGTSSERLGLKFHDPEWIRQVQNSGGLTGDNVLSYLVKSPFYQSGCNNDKVRMQGINLSAMDEMVGVEYVKLPCKPVIAIILQLCPASALSRAERSARRRPALFLRSHQKSQHKKRLGGHTVR